MMDLLTSNGNQYLRPEYLTPLPTTLDAKKSPLALLAQTCSQIGADPPSKTSVFSSLTASARSGGNSNGTNTSTTGGVVDPSSQNGNSSENERSASSSSSCGASSTKDVTLSTSTTTPSSVKKHKSHHHHQHRREKSHSKVNQSLNSNSSAESVSRPNNSSSITSTGIQHEKNVTTCSSPDDKGTSGAKTPGSKTTTPGNDTSPGRPSSTNTGNKSPMSTSRTSSSPPDTLLSKSHESSASSSSSIINNSSTSITTTSPRLTSKDKLNLNGPDLSPLGTLKSNQSSLIPFPSLYTGLPPPPSSLLTSGSGTSSAIPPYLHSYARLKAAAAAGEHQHHLSQLSASPSSQSTGSCRDPFCSGCQMGAAGHLSSLAAGKCPAGCVTCDHHKISSSAFASANSQFLFPGFPPLPPSLASLYSSVHQSSAVAAAAAASAAGNYKDISPFVCNWIAGESYCGKRFASSEELLQHLRSHTNLSNSEPGTLSSVMDRYGPPPSHPLLSSAHISRTYPTPPLSPLSSRYHPYSKPGGMNSFNFPPGFAPPGFSALAAAAAAAAAANNPLNPYYPYSLYGQRLGHP